MDDERLYQVALSMIPGIGDIMAKTLVSYCGSAKEIFKKNKSQLAKLPGFGSFHAEKILNFKDFSKAEDEIIKCGISPENYLVTVQESLKYSPSFIGACCGSGFEHIRKIKELFDGKD